MSQPDSGVVDWDIENLNKPLRHIHVPVQFTSLGKSFSRLKFSESPLGNRRLAFLSR